MKNIASSSGWAVTSSTVHPAILIGWEMGVGDDEVPGACGRAIRLRRWRVTALVEAQFSAFSFQRPGHAGAPQSSRLTAPSNPVLPTFRHTQARSPAALSTCTAPPAAE